MATEKYRFLLLEDWTIKTPWVGLRGSFETNWARFVADGMLMVRKGYAWDGCSGAVGQGELIPVPEGWPKIVDLTRTAATVFMPCTVRASLCHDVLYQYLETLEVCGVMRKQIDKWFYDHLVEDGFEHAWLYYAGVRVFGSLYHNMNLDVIDKYISPKPFNPVE